MIVRYATNRLQKICQDERERKKAYAKLDDKIAMRHNALEMAISMSDLIHIDPGGRWHPLHGNKAGEWAGKLSGNYRLVVIPERKGAEIVGIEEEVVTVTSIEDYH